MQNTLAAGTSARLLQIIDRLIPKLDAACDESDYPSLVRSFVGTDFSTSDDLHVVAGYVSESGYQPDAELLRQLYENIRSSGVVTVVVDNPNHSVLNIDYDEARFANLKTLVIRILRRLKELRGLIFERRDQSSMAIMPDAVNSDEIKNTAPANRSPDFRSVNGENQTFSILRTAVKKAYLAYRYACNQAEEDLTYEAAYQWLKENGTDEYRLPSLASFCRYLSEALRLLNESKYSRRAGREARSAVPFGQN